MKNQSCKRQNQSAALPMAARWPSQPDGDQNEQQQQQPANHSSSNAEIARCLTPFSHTACDFCTAMHMKQCITIHLFLVNFRPGFRYCTMQIIWSFQGFALCRPRRKKPSTTGGGGGGGTIDQAAYHYHHATAQHKGTFRLCQRLVNGLYLPTLNNHLALRFQKKSFCSSNGTAF